MHTRHAILPRDHLHSHSHAHVHARPSRRSHKSTCYRRTNTNKLTHTMAISSSRSLRSSTLCILVPGPLMSVVWRGAPPPNPPPPPCCTGQEEQERSKRGSWWLGEGGKRIQGGMGALARHSLCPGVHRALCPGHAHSTCLLVCSHQRLADLNARPTGFSIVLRHGCSATRSETEAEQGKEAPQPREPLLIFGSSSQACNTSAMISSTSFRPERKPASLQLCLQQERPLARDLVL